MAVSSCVRLAEYMFQVFGLLIGFVSELGAAHGVSFTGLQSCLLVQVVVQEQWNKCGTYH